LYEAAFSVVVAWSGPTRRANALLAVTVVAGFASSIFFPLTGALVQAYGWRTALLILAAVHGAVTVPLHLTVRRPSRPGGPTRQARRRRHGGAVRAALRDPGYRLLALVFVAQGTGVAIVSVHLVAYLRELGHRATFAATVAGLLGVLSVTGRLATTGLGRRFATHHITAAVFAVQGGGAMLLVLAGRSVAGAVAAVLAFGIGFGVATIARPTILADRYGTTGYATIAAVLAVPLTIAKAVAPLVASLIRQAAGSYTAVGLTVAALCLLAAAGLATLRPPRQPPDA
jgi:predicted MFS family arabinose efflux permease